jgi:hypothetical protein
VTELIVFTLTLNIKKHNDAVFHLIAFIAGYMDEEKPRYISIACPEFRYPKGLCEIKHAEES